MDPLSVGASVIAVVGATGKVIKGIHRLKTLHDAPRELDDLLAEVSQFEIVVQAIKEANDSPGPGLATLLERAQKVLVEFQSLIEYKLTEAGTSNKVDRWQWTRSSKDVERLRGKLRDVTANLVALVGVNTSTTLHGVSQVTNQVLSEQRKIISEQRQLSNQILPAVALLVQLLEESPSTQAALTSSLGNIRQLSFESGSQANNTMATADQSRVLPEVQITSKVHPQSTLRIGRSQTIRICDQFCVFFGCGYIETAGSSMFGVRCDTESCKAHAAPHIRVQYLLPQWLGSRMILGYFASSPNCSPELLLRVPRVIEGGSHRFYRLMAGESEDLIAAITKGDYMPYDVDEFGRTLLCVAGEVRAWDTLLCLSKYPDFCNPSSVTPLPESEICHSLIFTPQRHPIGEDQNRQNALLTELFPLIDWDFYMESQGFTALHQIVCGLSGVDLEFELQNSTVIDELDRSGRSALWYAVKHNRVNYVRKLLEQGANPNIGDPPIWEAVQGPPIYAIMEALLDRGAILNPFTRYGRLLWPKSFFEDKEILALDKLLIKHGIDINHGDYCGVTVLMELARGNVACRLEQLIKHGADIEIADQEGKTAIMHAVESSSLEGFDVLARAGARLDLKTITGSTILHFVIKNEQMGIRWARRERGGLCEAISNADLTKLDLDAKDEDGNRAFDLLRIRNGPQWEEYCRSKHIRTSFALKGYRRIHRKVAICALEKILHQIQEVQGVQEADQYPPLGEYMGRGADDTTVPRAWPAF